MELWVFDRSGMYSCEVFDISKSPGRFLTVLAGYVLMSDVELGISTLIKEDSMGKYILCRGDDGADAERLYLEDLPIFKPQNKNIVSDGLICYQARRSVSGRWEFVVRVGWSPRNEVKMLKLVKERKVSGVIQLFSHQDVDSTRNLHHGLRFGVFRRLKSSKQDDGAASMKAAMGGGVGGALDYTVETTDTGNSKNGESSKNKILSCIVVLPLGRSLHRFETIPELLKAFRDAIKGHRSLYQDGRILHQDICPGNIIITSSDSQGEAADPKGVLIDLDTARELSAGPGKQFQGVGTF